MLFADDIALISETVRGVNTKLEIWREALKSISVNINRNKTEYMESKFSESKFS